MDRCRYALGYISCHRDGSRGRGRGSIFTLAPGKALVTLQVGSICPGHAGQGVRWLFIRNFSGPVATHGVTVGS